MPRITRPSWHGCLQKPMQLRSQLDVIPTVGVPNYPFGSFIARFQSIERSKDWLDEGFKKVRLEEGSATSYLQRSHPLTLLVAVVRVQHRGNIFKIRQIYGWTVIVASVRSASSDASGPL